VPFFLFIWMLKTVWLLYANRLAALWMNDESRLLSVSLYLNWNPQRELFGLGFGTGATT